MVALMAMLFQRPGDASFKGLNIGISIIIPIKGRGFINQGSTLLLRGFMGI